MKFSSFGRSKLSLGFLILSLGGGAAACSQASTDDGAIESAYSNTSGESEAIRIPASYSMRSALGTGLNTVFMKATDTACIKYEGAAPPVANKVSLGDIKFQAQVITTSSSAEIASTLGIQAGMSVSYSGLVASGSGGVDFGFSKQSKTSQEAIYVLVKAWGEGNDLSHANQEPRLTEDALQAWEVGPYEFTQKCGNNYISRRNAGAGLYMIYRFTAKEGTTKQALHAAVNGKFNTRIVSGEAKVEVNTDFSEVLKVSDMEFNMSTYGLLTAAPNLDNLKAQKSEELEKAINSIFTALRDASAKGPESQEFNNLATISLQSSPYHTRLTSPQFTAIRDKHAAQGSAGKELDFLIPDMTRVQTGIDEMWSRMTELSDALADAEYIRDHQNQFNYAANPLGLYSGPDTFSMGRVHIPRLEADWKAVKQQVTDCKDGGTRSQKYAACWIDQAAGSTPYAKAAADVAEFRRDKPKRITYWTGSPNKVSYDQAVATCAAAGMRLPLASENRFISAVSGAAWGGGWYWLNDASKFACGDDSWAVADYHNMGWPSDTEKGGCTNRIAWAKPQFHWLAACVPNSGILAE